MVRPAHFRTNEQTSVNNFFQKKTLESEATLTEIAQEEFDGLVSALRKKGTQVTVFQDTAQPNTPDALFPNNWISFHFNQRVAIYPMYAPNRRAERHEGIFDALLEDGFSFQSITDYSEAEESNQFLEGTGSMVLDRVHKKAYCARSERSNIELLEKFCLDFDYKPIVFSAFQGDYNQRKHIYHTNVMMAIGSHLAVICLDCIDNQEEQALIKNSLLEDGLEIVEISEAQVACFAGNMLEVKGDSGKFMLMSQSAANSLELHQKEKIEKHLPILAVEIPTIEFCGGGSVRCMVAEVFG